MSSPLSPSSPSSDIPNIENVNDFNPIKFAEWRINELEKPEGQSMINEVLLMISQLVLGLLGEFETNTNTGEGVFPDVRIREFFGKIKAYDSNNKFITVFKGLMFIVLACLSFPYLVINYIINIIGFNKKFISPVLIYIILVVFSFSKNIDGYRLIWLLITYILLYSRDLTSGFFYIFYINKHGF